MNDAELLSFLFVGVIIGFYVLFMRPVQKEQERHKKQMRNLRFLFSLWPPQVKLRSILTHGLEPRLTRMVFCSHPAVCIAKSIRTARSSIYFSAPLGRHI